MYEVVIIRNHLRVRMIFFLDQVLRSILVSLQDFEDNGVMNCLYICGEK
jgi:hypothetical protein